MILKPGLRLKSQVSDTEIVVIKGSGDARAGRAVGYRWWPWTRRWPRAGRGRRPERRAPCSGKRYTDAGDTVEVLCTKPGAGALSLDGEALEVKSAKALPASD